jgi:hypothetical protein
VALVVGAAALTGARAGARAVACVLAWRVAVLRAFVAGAVERETTACGTCRVTPAVAPFWRATRGAAAGTRAGVLGAVFGALRCLLAAGLARRLGVTAPLVVADTARGAACAGFGAGAGASGAADGSAAGASGAALGAAVGAPGVPKPGGVQAQASAAPTTPTPSTDKTAKQKSRTRLRTDTPSVRRARCGSPTAGRHSNQAGDAIILGRDGAARHRPRSATVGRCA